MPGAEVSHDALGAKCAKMCHPHLVAEHAPHMASPASAETLLQRHAALLGRPARPGRLRRRRPSSLCKGHSLLRCLLLRLRHRGHLHTAVHPPSAPCQPCWCGPHASSLACWKDIHPVACAGNCLHASQNVTAAPTSGWLQGGAACGAAPTLAAPAPGPASQRSQSSSSACSCSCAAASPACDVHKRGTCQNCCVVAWQPRVMRRSWQDACMGQPRACTSGASMTSRGCSEGAPAAAPLPNMRCCGCCGSSTDPQPRCLLRSSRQPH